MGYAITVGLAIIVIGVLVLSIIFISKKGKSKLLFALIIGSVVLLAAIIPFLINESYKCGKWYITLWDAKDVLSFYGAVLSFCGTVILGALALWQNNILSKQNEQYRIMLMKKDLPKFAVEIVETVASMADIQMQINNPTDNVALNIEISEIEHRHNDGSLFAKYEGSKEKINILVNDTKGIKFQCSMNDYQSFQADSSVDKQRVGFTFKLNYTDVYGTRHMCVFQKEFPSRGSMYLIKEEIQDG